MYKFQVSGMSCAACSAKVEKAVKGVKGVESCAVSLLTNSMGVEGNVDIEKVIKAVEKAGYGAKLQDDSLNEEGALEDKESKKILKRLIISTVILLVLMYFSMGHMMFNFPVPQFIMDNHIYGGIIQAVLSLVIIIINRKFFVSGFKGVIHGSPNMDTLVAMGSGASYLYSMYALIRMAIATADKEIWMNEFYFESAATILVLITVGKLLEAKSKGRTTNALKSLMKLAPQNACVLIDGKEEIVKIEEVKVGDIVIVKPGENIPVDAVIIEGNTSVNEASLTGESIPVDKNVGDNVSAATTNLYGNIKCEAKRVGKDTTLSQIIKMVEDAATTKAPIAKIADKVSGIFVPVVIGIAMITFIVWMALGKELGFSIQRAISVLVISCPCSLGLATPVAIMVGNGLGARSGVLFKTAASLEATGKANIVVLDKTGTITTGNPKVTDIIEIDKDNLKTIALSIESLSEHPLAKAIVKSSDFNEIEKIKVDNFKVLPGCGLQGEINGKEVFAGNEIFISTKCEIDDKNHNAISDLSNEGKTPLVFSYDGKLVGIIAVADTLKEDAIMAIKDLKYMGYTTVMLTGDNERTANAIGKQVGVDKVIAGVLPSGKEDAIKGLLKDGKVIMVGDGINDAPALTRADIGMAIGAGTDVAIEAANVVLVKSNVKDINAAIRLSKATLRNIKENLFWAFFYNLICIPVAAGVLIPGFGIALKPVYGALAMSLSSFCVVMNALRLNLFNPFGTKSFKSKSRLIKAKNETKALEVWHLTVENMMCEHCEATVKKTLESFKGINVIEVSHEKNLAVIELSKKVKEELIKKALETEEYPVSKVEKM